jgi:hypothetical protein
MKLSKIDQLKKKSNSKKIEDSNIKLNKLKSKIIEIRSSDYLHEAFITFNNNAIPQTLISNKWSIFLKKYITRNLFFSKAMEPSDVIWENFGDSDLTQLFKIFLSYLVAIIIVGGKYFSLIIDKSISFRFTTSKSGKLNWLWNSMEKIFLLSL